MKTIITVILIIVAVAAVLLVLPFIILMFSFTFGIAMNEEGELQECIGCPKYTCRNTPRENRRRKTERRVSVETINTRQPI